MGWDVPEMYIERALGPGSEPRHWGLIAKPWHMYGSLEYSKAFLLGYGKYGPQSGWKPARELKGFPENPSRDVARLREASDCEVLDTTWLTLLELESIDIDVPLGLPDDIDPVLRDPSRYFRFSRIVDGEQEHVDAGQLDERTIRIAFEQEGGTIYDDGPIRAERATRRNYARNFENMLSFMRELCDGGQHIRGRSSPDQIRLIIWGEY